MRFSVTKFLLVSFVIFLCLDGYFLIKYLSSRNINKNQSIGFFKEKPGKCLILEEKYCSNYKIIKNPMNEEDLLVAFKLPKNTPLFSPISGFCPFPDFNLRNPNNNDVKKYSGLVVIDAKDQRATSIKKSFNFIFFNLKNDGCSVPKKGEIIGAVDDKIIDYYGDYNLIFSITKQSYSNQKFYFENGNDELKKLFP